MKKIQMTFQMEGKEDIVQDLSLKSFTKGSGVLILLNLNPASTVVIEAPTHIVRYKFIDE